ncbi:MAG: hypothetical protein ACI9NN_002076 [Bacteroidia bacterium]|jgi:hypothetical protein
MKKIIFSIAILSTMSIAALAQEVAKGLKWNEQNTTSISLVDVNPANGEIVGDATVLQLKNPSSVVANTIHHDQTNNLLYFQTEERFNNFASNQKMRIVRASNGESLRDVSLTNAMAPFVIGDQGMFGFVGVERTFNGYSNNDDDISLVIFDMGSGKTTVKIKLSNLSFATTNAPFVGELENNTGNQNGEIGMDQVSLSTTCFLPTTRRLIFSAKDVVGVQRMFDVDTKTGQLISSHSINFDVLDMTFDVASNLLYAVFIAQNEAGKNTLYAGTLSANNYKVLNKIAIRVLNNYEYPIMDGSIKVGESGVYVSKKDPTGRQTIYTITKETNEVVNVSTAANAFTQVDFEFPFINVKNDEVSLLNAISMYPNPAVNAPEVTIASEQGVLVTKLTVRNNLGQVIQVVEINNGTVENRLNVTALKPGIYFVEVESIGASLITKKLMVQ